MNIRTIDERIRRFFRSIRQPFRMMIGRTSTGVGIKKVSGEALAGEAVRDAELIQQYGYHSVPPEGTMGVAVALGGATSHAVIVATQHATVGIDLKTGEVALVHQDGHFIHLKNGRIIEAECDEYVIRCKTWRVEASSGATMDTPVFNVTKQAQIDGLVTGKGGLSLSNEKGGGGSAVASIAGTMRVTEDVIAGGVSQIGHQHKDSLGGVTGNPIR
ncbi:phage baseplate assembly protein V [Achromobacter seleniivolatilans]|uniref:Phage baseplate assembly protein V n=1 Tax=Achromobacter seleniivolatilans TaxID=3047478 RepID=A0ABY9M7U3_9BURK|nr:phage baseplate assembly protein V [Achromobacter sp. R39]WMD23106.1 phage baseplate assembly protein V [Achromobacter sp. R39]